MADVLIHGDTMRSPELRHEVPVPIPDAFLYAEKEGPPRRDPALAGDSACAPGRARARDHPARAARDDELLAQGNPTGRPSSRLLVRACREMGLERRAVPPGFPVAHADYLRANGIEVVVERELFDNRRRSKNETEIAGIRRAQRACEAALDASRELLRKAEPNGGGLELDGEPLTCERIKQRASAWPCAAARATRRVPPRTRAGPCGSSISVLRFFFKQQQFDDSIPEISRAGSRMRNRCAGRCQAHLAARAHGNLEPVLQYGFPCARSFKDPRLKQESRARARPGAHAESPASAGSRRGTCLPHRGTRRDRHGTSLQLGRAHQCGRPRPHVTAVAGGAAHRLRGVDDPLQRSQKLMARDKGSSLARPGRRRQPRSAHPSRHRAWTAWSASTTTSLLSTVEDKYGISRSNLVPRRARPPSRLHCRERPTARSAERSEGQLTCLRAARPLGLAIARRHAGSSLGAARHQAPSARTEVPAERRAALADLRGSAADRNVPILIHGGRGLPPMADDGTGRRPLSEGAADASHTPASPISPRSPTGSARARPASSSTPVWSPLDLLGLYGLVGPGTGRLRVRLSVRPAARLAAHLAAHRAPRSTLRRPGAGGRAGGQCESRRRPGHPPHAPSRPRDTFSQPIALARYHHYLDGDTAPLDAASPIASACSPAPGADPSNGHRAELDDPRAAAARTGHVADPPRRRRREGPP